MGRPIASRYFGNRNTNGVGGEGVATANVYVAGTGYYSANAAVTFSAPQITGGATATGTLTLNGSGNVSAVIVTSAGSGYTAAPTALVTGANVAVSIVGNIALTSSETATLAFLSTADGGSSAVASDIVKQVGARRYKVQNAQGSGKVKLVTSAPAAGECRMTATDSDGGTYYVKKLESRTACLLPDTGTQFLEDAHAVWTLDSAEAGVSVVISNN
jgi:hypothetical protein